MKPDTSQTRSKSTQGQSLNMSAEYQVINNFTGAAARNDLSIYICLLQNYVILGPLEKNLTVPFLFSHR